MASSARLDELKKKFDENPRRYFAPLANEHRKSGDLDQAIALCRTHLPQQPGHISGHIVLAQALFEAGSLDEAREIFHTALGLDPENLIALRYLGDIARDAADIQTARSWYQRVLEVDPRNEEIVQLVRELDAPPGVPVATRDESEIGQEARFAPPAAPAAAPATVTPAPADHDARFAPLSLDEVDLDDAVSAPASSGTMTPNEVAPAPETHDVHAAWTIGEPPAELPTLDTPDIDPFDLDPSGGVDSLYDPNAPQAEDFFLTELSGPSEDTERAHQDSTYPADSWTAATDTSALEPAVDHGMSETTAFEESDFYLEPPPPEPEQPVANEHASADATAGPSGDDTSEPTDQVSMPGLDAFAAEYYVPPEEERREAARSTGSHDRITEPEPNAAPVAELAEQATAEWQQPMTQLAASGAADAPTDDLGLEVMEFVPPSSEPTPSPTYTPPADTDPILGRTLSASPSPESSTPAAFVTETMAELYLQQGFRNEALAVYRELLARSPADASLRDRIEQIESGSISSIGMASVSENVVESALKRQQARPGRSVRSFFAALASRRAPAPREYLAEAPADAFVEHGEPEYAAPDYATPDPMESRERPGVTLAGVAAEPEPETVAESLPEPVSEPALAQGPDRITPLMSAADTLAAFDPFAETTELSPFADPNTQPTPDAAPNGMASPAVRTPVNAPSVSRPTPMAMPAQTPPSALTTPEPFSPRRSLDDLFPDAPVPARAEAAAQTLATAFGRPEPQGRPTRAASNELSLDHVFRGAPDGAPAADGGFSFDQFFSDSRASTSDVAAPASSSPDSGRGSNSGDAHDIEQFTAWLEGLKKK